MTEENKNHIPSSKERNLEHHLIYFEQAHRLATGEKIKHPMRKQNIKKVD